MLLKVDREKRLERCGERAPLIAKVAEVYGWSKLWEAALDLADAMSHHGRGNHPCHLCDAAPLEEAICIGAHPVYSLGGTTFNIKNGP